MKDAFYGKEFKMLVKERITFLYRIQYQGEVWDYVSLSRLVFRIESWYKYIMYSTV